MSINRSLHRIAQEGVIQTLENKDKEIERLNNIIKDITAELEILLQSEDFELITMQLRNIVFRLKGSDKEWIKKNCLSV